MPKYLFDCAECGTQFNRSLKLGEHPTHTCPSCGEDAPRVFEGFSHSFAAGTPTNSGVSKHDYPTADHAVGSNADVRWAEIHEREKVKQQVRAMGNTRPLIRENGKGQDYIQYTAASPKVIETRKKLVKEINSSKE